MSRIGVFVCHCGENIARTVDVESVCGAARDLPGVAHVSDYPFMCSSPGQKLVKQAIRTHNLTGVVVAACSPHMHETTFRGAVAEGGLNPFLCEIANIREQCSWVHTDPAEATAKASEIVEQMVAKVRFDTELQSIEVPVTRRALVVGGGIAGIRSALDIAKAGYSVTLVEREPSLGGNMARLSETFPTLDCSQCILTPLMVEVSHHPNIELLTYSEVEGISGYVGNFNVRIRRKARFVLEDCTGCDDCARACPVATPNDFDMGLSWRKAVYIPFPQAVPAIYTLDTGACVNAELESANGRDRVLACERCSLACAPGVIDYDMRPEILEREVGVVVLATGYKLWDASQAPEYGYGRYPDVVNGLEFERLLSASGPTFGELRRPSDGKVPKSVVFIQCVGSRDPEHGVAYCSRTCCMYTAKHALLYKHKVPDGKAYVFYIDIRAAGKGYEEFINRVMMEDEVLYLRGRVGRVVREGDRMVVYGADTLSGQSVQIDAEMVVLATAMVPAAEESFGRMVRASTDQYGFFQEIHPKLRPVETMTAGVLLAGAAQGPKDIPDTVAQASAAASKALEILAQPVFEREPTVARVNESVCIGCLDCQRVCPYGAIDVVDVTARGTTPAKAVARVNEAMCEGCGICTSVCRSRAIDIAGFDDEQVFAQITAVANPSMPVTEALAARGGAR